ncbi:glycoside hydrolase family 3 protein [Muricomes intestini]|uniref:glycoside hydrolase family 3 protein n=1 Tax=Muricomes intestini TaxID=1796634 RepID=UPI002FDE6C7B
MTSGRGNKSKKKHLIWLIVLLFLIVLLAGGYFIFRENQDRTDEKETKEPAKGGSDEQPERKPDNNSGGQEPDNQEPELTAEEKRELEIDKILKDMPLEDKVCQLFFVRPEALTGVDTATQAGDMTKEALDSYPVGGVVLFSENIQNEDQLRTMLVNLQSYSKYPLFTGVDEEGGPLVARVANSGTIQVPLFPDMQEIGNTLDPEKAYEVGNTIGGYLKQLGFNVDFAPVADVAVNPENRVIGARSFGSDANLVSQMVAREVEGMQEQDVSAVLKHFPGHGDTSEEKHRVPAVSGGNGDTREDSHEQAAISNKTVEELRSTEFLPFQAGMEAGADMVMAGHISVPSITGDNTPASLSEQIITGCLRDELGYDGIVITDSMSMGAIVNYYDPAGASVMVIQAGGDMILMPQDFPAARQAVLDGVNNHTITEERLDQSLRRIYRKKLERVKG